MKKALKPVELFVTVGLIATVTACGGTATSDGDVDTDGGGAPTEDVAEGGEGGEGGEGSADYAADAFEDKLSGQELVGELQQGGYVIFFRHAQTTEDYADQADPNLDLNDCSTQRELSEAGKADAVLIGEAFEALAIPVGDVITSEYCRAYNTAELAFGRYEKTANLNFAPAEEYTPEQIEMMKGGITPLLSAIPANGQNTVLIGHDDVFDAATGIYPEPQGVAYIVKPDGEGFELMANLNPDEWVALQQ